MEEIKTGTKPKNNLKKQAFGLTIGLSIQYLLGMYTNLFVQFPKHINIKQSWEFAWKQLPLAAHIIIGISLIIGASALLAKAIKQKNKHWIISASIGAITILGAFLSGARFIPTQANTVSYSMAVAFIIAVLAYCWGIYKDTN